MAPIPPTKLPIDFNRLLQQAYALVREAERVGQIILAENEALRLKNRELEAQVELNKVEKRKREAKEERERSKVEKRKREAEEERERSKVEKRKRETEEERGRSIKKIKQHGQPRADGRASWTSRLRPRDTIKKPKNSLSSMEPLVFDITLKPNEKGTRLLDEHASRANHAHQAAKAESPKTSLRPRTASQQQQSSHGTCPPKPQRPLQDKPQSNVKLSKTIHKPLNERQGKTTSPSTVIPAPTQAVQNSHPLVEPTHDQAKPAPVSTLSANDELLANGNNRNDKIDEAVRSEPIQYALQNIDHAAPARPPRALRNRGSECFANSVLQCLATVLPPEWLEDYIGAHFMTKKSDGKPEIYRPVDLFLSLTAELRNNSNKALTSTEVLRALSADAGERDRELDGSEQADAFDFLSMILDCLSEGAKQVEVMHPLIDALFRVKELERRRCQHCGVTELIRDENDWVIKYEGNHHADKRFTVPALLKPRTKPLKIEDYTCENCLRNGGVILQYAGLERLPEILVVRANRAGSAYDEMNFSYFTYGITLEETLDMRAYAPPGSERTKYSLWAVVQHSGRSMNGGHYYALTKDENSCWFDCNDEHITSLGDFDNMARKSRKHGLPYLLFYRRENASVASPQPTQPPQVPQSTEPTPELEVTQQSGPVTNIMAKLGVFDRISF